MDVAVIHISLKFPEEISTGVAIELEAGHMKTRFLPFSITAPFCGKLFKGC